MDFNGNMMFPSNFGSADNGTNMTWNGQHRSPAHGNSMGYGSGILNMPAGNSANMRQSMRQQVASQFAVPMANASFPVPMAVGNSTNMDQPMRQQVAFQSTVPMASGTLAAPMSAPHSQAPALPMGYGNLLAPQSTAAANMFARRYGGAIGAPLPRGDTVYAPIGAHQIMAGFPQQRLPAEGQIPGLSMGYNQYPAAMPADMSATGPIGYGLARPAARIDLINKPATAAEIVDLTQDNEEPTLPAATAPAAPKVGTKRKGTASPEKPAKRARYGVLETPVNPTAPITPLEAAKPPALDQQAPTSKAQRGPRKDPHNLMGSLYYTRIKQPVNTRLQGKPQDEPERPVYDPRNFVDVNQTARRRRKKAKTSAAEPQESPRKRNGQSQVKPSNKVVRKKPAGSSAPKPVTTPVQREAPAIEAEERSDSQTEDDAEGSEDDECEQQKYEQQQPARTPAALPPQPIEQDAELVINEDHQQASPASPTPQALKQAEEFVANEDSPQPSPAEPVPQLIEDEPAVIVNDTASLFGSVVSLEDDDDDAVQTASEPKDDGLLYLEMPADTNLLSGRRKLYLADDVPDYVLKDATQIAAWQAEIAETEDAAVSEGVDAENETDEDTDEEGDEEGDAEEELDFDALFTAAFKQAADEESDEDDDEEDDEDGDAGDNTCRYQSSDEEISEDES